MKKTAEQIVKETENYNGRANKAAINKAYRAQDDSHLWPILGRFNATNKAIRRAQKFEREGGYYLTGLEYCLFLENAISEIVNDPKLF